MHLPVQANAFDHRGSIHLQGTTVIVEGHPGNFADHSVGQATQKFRRTAASIRCFRQPDTTSQPWLSLSKRRDICRIVLQIRIKGTIASWLRHRCRPASPRFVRRSAERNHSNPGSGVRDLTQDRKRPIGRTVIHEDHFDIKCQPLKHRPQLLTQRRQIGFLLEDRDHHRDGAMDLAAWAYSLGAINRRSNRFPSECSIREVDAQAQDFPAKPPRNHRQATSGLDRLGPTAKASRHRSPPGHGWQRPRRLFITNRPRGARPAKQGNAPRMTPTPTQWRR